MPGNEVGDRTNNFFQQGKLSQGYHQAKTVEDSRHGFNNNYWSGHNWQISGAINSKNYNAQQSGTDRGKGNQSSLRPYRLMKFEESNLRPEFSNSQRQNQHLILNGFVDGPQVSCTMQNEANGVRVGTKPDHCNLTSRGMSFLEQQNGGSQHTNTSATSFGTKESAINFGFLDGHQQMSGQQQRMLQSLARQQSGISDTQLLQQQVTLKQMQELQRQQQFQQLEAMQRNTMNQISSFSNQPAGNHTPSYINGTPMHELSNYPCPSQVMAGSPNWLQRGASSAMLGYVNGLVMPPEQEQSLRLMGLIPQQAPQSLYGVPVPNARSGGGFLTNQVDKTGLHQVPVQGNLSGNQHHFFTEQMNLPDGTTLPKQGFEGKGFFDFTSRQGSGNAISLENFAQLKQRPGPELDEKQNMSVSLAPSLPGQTMNQVAYSQAPAGLDPTEEKILFGTDDNIWESFSGSLNGSIGGGCNHSDGALPSIQSGSWSALMQSAVGESSSSDIRQQGECSGMGVQNSGSLTANQQPSGFPYRGEQPAEWADKYATALMSSRPLPDASLSSGYHNSGLQKSLTNQHREILLNRSSQQSSEERKERLDPSQPKAIAEESQSHESAYFSGDFNSKNTTSSWSHQQTTSSANRLGGFNFIQSVHDGGKMTKDQEKFQGNNRDNVMCVNIGDTRCTSKLNAGPNSNVEMDRLKINTKDDVCISDNNHQREFWRSISSGVKSGVDDLRKCQQHLNKGMPQVFHPSANSCDHSISEMHEMGNSDKRENSSDSYCSNLSNRASTGGMRKNVWLDARDTAGMSGGKENSSGQVGRNSPGPCRFDYQPMGDLNVDVEHSLGSKHIMQSQAMEYHHSGVPRGHDGQSNFLSPSTNSSPNLEKSSLSNFQGEIRVSYGISPSRVNAGYVSPTPTSVDRSAGISTPNNSVASSQNMLELLQKVDQSKQRTMNLNSMDHNRLSSASEMEGSDRNAAFSPRHSFSSQGFGLQLAPPSQGLQPPNLVVASQNAWLSQAASSQSVSSVHDALQVGAQATKADIPVQTHEPLTHNAQGGFPASFSSGSLYLKSLLHNQQMANTGANTDCDQPGNVSFDKQASHDKQVISAAAQRQKIRFHTDHSNAQASTQMATLNVPSSLLPSIMSGMYQKDNLSSTVPNLWTNMTMEQQLLVSRSLNHAELLKNRFQLNNVPGTSASIQQKQDGEGAMKEGDGVDSQGFVSRKDQPMTDRQSDANQKTAIVLQGKETFATNPSDPSLPNSADTRKDTEVFGCSLKPNNNMVDDYSLLHQMQAIKVLDPNIQQVKRFKGPDNDPDDHRMVGKSEYFDGLNYAEKNASARCASVSSSDAKITNFIPEPNSDHGKRIQEQHANAASQDILSCQGEPQKLNDSNVASRNEGSQISLQMAPTWFKQYGTFKNGQLVPVHDVQRAQLVASTEQDVMVNKSSKDLGTETTLAQVNTVVDTGQMGNVWPKAPQVPSEHLSSLCPFASIVTGPGIDSLRSKKRKSVTTDFLPWHKEVALGYQRLPNMSSAEEDWAQAGHRLIEKIEDETDMHEDVSPVVRSRRRLVLATQLMQQIFHPPASILSVNASKEYETVAYFVARLVLADACSLTCQSESDSCVSQDENLSSEKHKANERTSDQYLKKVVEQFINKARGLDTDFLRLDKRVSVLDLRLECQDLERFSVINRFARFHGRGQVEGTETSSSSDVAAGVQRARLQRYVNACPTQKNLPERVQCLSL